MKLVYNIVIHLYHFSIKLASFFLPKAKLWVNGRNQQLIHIRKEDLDSEIIWFHCASLGEFEQARPMIERLKLANPPQSNFNKIKIVLTFFSPSGYEVRKNYPHADYVFYLPIDTKTKAKQFIHELKPSKVFFVKYEFWFNYLHELSVLNIPTYLISGIFRDNHYFFKWYGAWFRNQLNSFTHFYLQDNHSQILLNQIGYKNTSVCGDTRFDRVADIAKNAKRFPLIEKFKGKSNLLIAGSTWPKDEEIVSSQKLSDFKWVIVPHEINEKHILKVMETFSHNKSVEYNLADHGHSVPAEILRYSEANEENVLTADVLIIDNIGMLSSLYNYGSLAFIGGGFGKGIHNILEAATFGMPVIFGPEFHKFNEAKELIEFGGAFWVSNAIEYKNTLKLLNDDEVLKTASQISKFYVQSRVGASSKIISSINW